MTEFLLSEVCSSNKFPKSKLEIRFLLFDFVAKEERIEMFAYTCTYVNRNYMYQGRLYFLDLPSQFSLKALSDCECGREKFSLKFDNLKKNIPKSRKLSPEKYLNSK